MSKPTVFAVATLGSLATFWNPSYAKAETLETHIAMVNRSSAIIFNVQTADPVLQAWSPDLLEVDVIFPGEIADVVVAVRDGRCVMDMKMTTDDGTMFVTRNINVCTVGHYDFTDETLASTAVRGNARF